MKNNLVNITFPVLNEEKVLEKNILKFYRFLDRADSPYRYEITIFDNGSCDGTPKIGKKLDRDFKEINYLRSNRKGKSFAIRSSFRKSKASILSYIDVDLSTDLNFFIPMINMISNDYDLVVGNRLGPNSKVIGRSFKREFLSRGYNFLLRSVFSHNIKDHQCGFKAMKKDSFLELDGQIQEIKESYFLDTELVIRAIKSEMKVGEIDIVWRDNDDSKIKIARTILENIKGVARLKKEFLFK